jgi:hypothetical protein
MLIVRVHHLEMVYMRACIDISVDGGLLIFQESGVRRRSSNDEGSQGVNADSNTLGYVCVLHWPDHRHLANMALKERDDDCAK